MTIKTSNVFVADYELAIIMWTEKKAHKIHKESRQ